MGFEMITPKIFINERRCYYGTNYFKALDPFREIFFEEGHQSNSRDGEAFS